MPSVKLDSGFIHNQENGFKTYATVQALTRVFHEMDFVVVAEGVETVEEAQVLKEMEVDRIQGYVFARPMKLTDLLEFYHNL